MGRGHTERVGRIGLGGGIGKKHSLGLGLVGGVGRWEKGGSGLGLGGGVGSDPVVPIGGGLGSWAWWLSSTVGVDTGSGTGLGCHRLMTACLT